MIGIYKITSPTNKIYIGQSINIEKRWKTYSRLQCKGQTRLYNSLQKYGADKHIFEVLEECSENTLLERETYWKDHFDVMNVPSLCCRIDGKGGRDSDETKSRKVKPKNLTPEQKIIKNQKISNNNSGKQRSQEIKNKLKGPKSDEHKQKIKEALLGREIKWNVGKPKTPILQYNLNGEFIREWDYIKEAAKHYNLNSANIVANCKGRYKSAGGFIWKYKIG
jgi:group I intron endonuclease